MADATTPSPTPAADPSEILRSRTFIVVLVLAAAIGVIVSLFGWGFLELVSRLQTWVFTDVPHGLGLDPVPSWWPLPMCALAGLPVAFAIARLPGGGGHVPAFGLQAGSTEPNMVPGVVLAALATLGFGLVLGPEAPLLAIGSGVAVACVRAVKRDAPPTLVLVLGAAGAFAAIAVIFGSPIVGAIIIIEATGLGGPTLPLILLPGLLAAGVGSFVFLGMAHWSGLSTAAFSLQPLHFSQLGTPTAAEVGWAIALGVAGALLTMPIRQLGVRVAHVVAAKTFVVVPACGLAVGALAFVFSHVADKPTNVVLFSGQDALGNIVGNAGTFSVATLLMLLVFKGLAWGISLGSFRGGPTFPALFLGAVGGVAASHLPGLPASAAIPVGMGVMVAAFLRLPLSAVIIAIVLSPTAGRGVDPLVIIGVVVAYVATLALEGRFGRSNDAEPHVVAEQRAE